MGPARTVCNKPDCPTLTDRGRCDAHQREADQARGTSTQRGYARQPEHRAFRAAVLARDPMCVIPTCTAASTVADHYPISRRELVRLGLDPNDPRRGRGLCHPCHSRETAAHQPGGWHR